MTTIKTTASRSPALVVVGGAVETIWDDLGPTQAIDKRIWRSMITQIYIVGLVRMLVFMYVHIYVSAIELV